jgi:hypothetical protein
MISLVMSQSRLFEQDVFLVDYLENEARQPQRSLSCVCLLRPTSKNFEAVAAEVAEPRYAQYHLCKDVFAWRLLLLLSSLYQCR